MNAKELYEIVRGVPRKAWPAGWVWLEDKKFFWHDFHCTSLGSWNDADQAVMLFEASMMRWLTTKFETAVYHCPEYGNYTVSQDVKEWGGPSLVEALAAACKAVRNTQA